ncbi:MAG: hypothetical protein OHK0052_27740 [Anaerolineales bacterium]
MPTTNIWICEKCDWGFLPPEGSAPPPRCPHCFEGTLAGAEGNAPTPELVIPFGVNETRLSSAVETFAGGIPFAPRDLQIGTLRQRIQKIYLPMYLVDAQVQAEWHAECGFNYNVVSHQEQFSENRGGWQSRQVEETRIRWEPRVGQLQRTYHNIPAPALENHNHLLQTLGNYDLRAARPFTSEDLQTTLLRLPNRTTADAWHNAEQAFTAAAGEECRQAAAADHIRQFRWQPQFTQQNWSLLLMPLYSTFYLDDENRPQPVLIHGVSGKISGSRRASMARAQSTALTLVIVAAAVFMLGLLVSAAGIIFPPALLLGGLMLILAVALALGAVYPIFAVWNFNRK